MSPSVVHDRLPADMAASPTPQEVGSEDSFRNCNLSQSRTADDRPTNEQTDRSITTPSSVGTDPQLAAPEDSKATAHEGEQLVRLDPLPRTSLSRWSMTHIAGSQDARAPAVAGGQCPGPVHTALGQALDMDVGKSDTVRMDSPTDGQAATFARLFGSWESPRSTPPPPCPPEPAPTEEEQPPPTTQRAVAAAMRAADADVLRSGDADQIQDQIHVILAASQRRSLLEFTAGPLVSDGGVLIDSMSAVFACGIIDRTLGGGVLAHLANNSRPGDFVSTRALATLVVRLRSGRAA